jgi:16S rRNA (guanine966-N2)-methyltransferase
MPQHSPGVRPRRGAHARELRIIAGHWRGRRWRFPPADIRPTPDRVRETLFNWLAPRIVGARCLDLYAGSGALGLEALSRGAREVIFVDAERSVTQALKALLAAWQAEAEVLCLPARRYLEQAEGVFDIAFLDPPFAAEELAAAAAALEARSLREGSLIYLEHARRTPLPALPAGWREIRAGHAGEVGYHLFERL